MNMSNLFTETVGSVHKNNDLNDFVQTDQVLGVQLTDSLLPSNYQNVNNVL